MANLCHKRAALIINFSICKLAESQRIKNRLEFIHIHLINQVVNIDRVYYFPIKLPNALSKREKL